MGWSIFHHAGLAFCCRSRLSSNVRPTKTPPVLHPNQFDVNEAWIAFQLNDAPIHTDQDGSFNCLGLMDAASCFILGSEFIAASDEEASQMEVRRLIKKGKNQKNQLPKTLFLAREQAGMSIEREAVSQKIEVIRVPESELLVFIGEARKGFRGRFGAGTQ